MEIQEHVLLKDYTGFKIGGPARYFAVAQSIPDIEQAVAFASEKQLPLLMLGGGTNMLVSDEGYEGFVLKIETHGTEFTEDGDTVLITAQAGESWDGLVAEAVNRELWGIENLSHIPGTVGAFVIQNVGAYGQDASQVVESVQVLDTATKTVGTVSKEDCYFSYRTSVFNSLMKGRFIILSVTIRLSKTPKPNLQYADVHRYFNPGCDVADHDQGHEHFAPEIDEVRQSIIEIRDKKFTLPTVIPNSGSFFKNLLLNEDEYQVLEKHIKQNFTEQDVLKLQSYKNRLTKSSVIKIPTAFLIDMCGLKGTAVGGAKVNETQPLVIINFTGTATACDVLGLMQQERKIVFEKTGMEIKPEPELIGFNKEELDNYFKI
jgi:UDP-N-acetylmuramate dehydrogenase